KWKDTRIKIGFITFFLIAVSLPFAFGTQLDNGLPHEYLTSNRQELPKQFAQLMEAKKAQAEISMMQIGSIDRGFYLAAGAIPPIRYFDNPNISYESYPKMIDSQIQAIKESKTEFVIVTSFNGVFLDFAKKHPEQFTEEGMLKVLLENYHIIESQGKGFRAYYLMQRK
ncbi:MAG: hypothetical protein LBV67_03495, partial [Streptococcaceae bacterium]|nr:hypothetical protein [Streptococcaceae bacterium]